MFHAKIDGSLTFSISGSDMQMFGMPRITDTMSMQSAFNLWRTWFSMFPQKHNTLSALAVKLALRHRVITKSEEGKSYAQNRAERHSLGLHGYLVNTKGW